MDKMAFYDIKEKYNELRENERKRIIDFLAKRKDEQGNVLFSKINGADYSKYRYNGGSGSVNYGERKDRPLTPTYNLSNWKYIETKCKGKYIFISLQCFDLDPNYHNVHVLFDRVGVLIEEPQVIKFEGEKVSDAFIRMKITNFELPLSDDEIDSLIDSIIEQIN